MNTSVETLSPGYSVAADEETVARPKAKRPFWKKLYYALSLLVLAALVADTAWRLSGSNEWQLAKDEEGVKMYTMKVPGDKLVKVRTVMEGRYTLSQLTSQHIIDDNLDTCKSWIPGCAAFTRIQEFDPIKGYDKDMWRLDFPGPFKDREMLINTIIAQDKTTKAVTLDVVAMPNTLPHNPDVVRVERMHNRWTFTPLPNGNVLIELIQDTDLGGFFPYFLMNMVTPEEGHKFFAVELREFLQKDKYANAKLAFLDDIR